MGFLRTWQVVTARPLNGAFFRDSPLTVLTIDAARVRFRVEKSLDAEPNTAHIDIYNLSEGTRGEFAQRPLAVRLYAGNDGTPKRLFGGDVYWATSRPERPEWVTSIEAGDGQRAIRQAKVRRPYKAGIKASSVIRDIVESMELKVPTLDPSSMFALQQEFASGYTMEGPSHRELGKVLARFGLRWSIQDGRLQILTRRGKSLETPVVVSRETGLQGSPELGQPKVESDPPTVKFKTQLKPELTPGRAVLLTSRTAKGTYRVDRVRHVGDSHGSEWYSEVEASA